MSHTYREARIGVKALSSIDFNTPPERDALHEAERGDVSCVYVSRQRLGEYVGGVVNAGDANEFGETGLELLVDVVSANAGVFRAMLDVGGLGGVHHQ